MNMTPEQMTAIRCAYADLQGSAQDHLSLMGGTHDWEAHNQSIADLEREFPFLVERPLCKIIEALLHTLLPTYGNENVYHPDGSAIPVADLVARFCQPDNPPASPTINKRK